jgi:DNA-damage-inducible protein J
MTANKVVRARIDEQVKKEAEAVLASIGLTVSDAFRLLMVRVAREKALPFDPLVPNDETVEAMKAARRGELVTAGAPENLLNSLNADGQVHQQIQARLQTRKVRQVPKVRRGA